MQTRELFLLSTPGRQAEIVKTKDAGARREKNDQNREKRKSLWFTRYLAGLLSVPTTRESVQGRQQCRDFQRISAVSNGISFL